MEVHQKTACGASPDVGHCCQQRCSSCYPKSLVCLFLGVQELPLLLHLITAREKESWILHSPSTLFFQRSIGSRGTLSYQKEAKKYRERVRSGPPAKMSGAVKHRLRENKTGTRHWALDRERMSLLSKEIVASTKFENDAKIHFAKEEESQEEKPLLEKAMKTLTGYSYEQSRRLLV